LPIVIFILKSRFIDRISRILSFFFTYIMTSFRVSIKNVFIRRPTSFRKCKEDVKLIRRGLSLILRLIFHSSPWRFINRRFGKDRLLSKTYCKELSLRHIVLILYSSWDICCSNQRLVVLLGKVIFRALSYIRLLTRWFSPSNAWKISTMFR